MTSKVSKKGNSYVLPREKESSEGRLSRYKKLFNRSRVKNITQENRYRRAKVTKRLQRDKALSREEYREEREKKKYYS